MQPYERIAADLRAEIKSGKLKVGQKLPSTRELIGRFGVSAPTVHHGIAVLREEQLIETRDRVGSFVRDPAEVVEEKALREEVAELREEVAGLRESVERLHARMGEAE